MRIIDSATQTLEILITPEPRRQALATGGMIGGRILGKTGSRKWTLMLSQLQYKKEIICCQMAYLQRNRLAQQRFQIRFTFPQSPRGLEAYHGRQSTQAARARTSRQYPRDTATSTTAQTRQESEQHQPVLRSLTLHGECALLARRRALCSRALLAGVLAELRSRRSLVLLQIIRPRLQLQAPRTTQHSPHLRAS